jgi:hypothetical protein
MKNQKLFLSIILISGVTLTGLSLNNRIQTNNSLNLQTIMRLIMADINMINEGIYTQNFQLIEQGAAAINQHPPLSDETRKFIQKTLDDQMPASSQHDMNKVLQQYRIVQQGCVSCHTSFRETIIQARTAK